MDLTSPSNPRVLAAAALRGRRAREKAGLTLVDGGRELLRAIDGGADVVTVFVQRAGLRTADARRAVDRLADAGAELLECGPAAFRRIAYGDRDEGVVAVLRVPSAELPDLRLPADPLLVVTEDVEKPGNVGAIMRSADGARADAVIAADAGTDLFNPNVIRASVGAVFSVPVARANAAEVRSWLTTLDIRIIAARVDASTLYTDAVLSGPVALVLGSEATGLTAAWDAPGVESVRLPMLGLGDSLNVSVTAAVLLYEARRQRGLPGREG